MPDTGEARGAARVAQPRFVILAEGAFGPLTSKTANACIRYTPEGVAAVIDSARAGRTVQDVLGYGGAIPVLPSLDAAMDSGPESRPAPTALLLGVATVGGTFDESWRPTVLAAIERRLDVWSGLHVFLAEDPQIANRARAAGVHLHDLRKPPRDLDIARGRVRDVAATVVLTVGSDSNVGKMTTALQMCGELRRSGLRAQFAATGQTGILIEGSGIAVDAVVADFIAGAAERVVLDAARDADIVIVEGQGSIIHASYSGVTLGLLHGTLPHAMVLCVQPTRITLKHLPWVAIPPLPVLIRLLQDAAAPLRPAPVIAVALNTFDLDDAKARAAVEAVVRETGLPACDPVRHGATTIAEAVARLHQDRCAVATTPATVR